MIKADTTERTIHRLREFKPLTNPVPFVASKKATRAGKYGIPAGYIGYRVLGFCYVSFLKRYLSICVSLPYNQPHSLFSVHLGPGSTFDQAILEDFDTTLKERREVLAGTSFRLSYPLSQLKHRVIPDGYGEDSPYRDGLPYSCFYFNESGLNAKLLDDILDDRHFEYIGTVFIGGAGETKIFNLWEDVNIRPRYYFAPIK